MRFITLTQEFYTKYSDCTEILDKEDRPYALMQIEINGILFGIPIRHHINHPFAFKTIDDRGIDYTKAVVIEKSDYISDVDAWIDTAEWRIISRNEDKIRYEFKKYLNQYKRALKHKDNPRSDIYLKYSALQYFDF